MKMRWIFLFWGWMDLIYIGRFCYLNFSQGRVPLYSDIQSFIRLSAEHGSVSVLLFSLSFILNISIILSMVLFFLGARLLPHLVYAQTPLRLLCVVPSLSFFLWLAKAGGATSTALLLGLLLLSEVIKFCSIFFREKLR